MTATQALTGQGGWPMSVFLTPDRRPFYAGTYFPPSPRHGLPSFRQVLECRQQRLDESAGREVLHECRRHRDRARRPAPRPARRTRSPTRTAGTALVAARSGTSTRVHGGFGGAPKFPPSMVLEALLRFGDEDGDRRRRGWRPDPRGDGSRRHLRPARRRLRPLQRRQPLGRAALREDAVRQRAAARRVRALVAAAPGRRPLAERVVEETVEWLLTEMRSAEGGFTASLDADSLDSAWPPDRGRLLRLVPGPVDRGAGPRGRARGRPRSAR